MVSRKQFIESKGANCSNWRYSWSFVNHSEKFVIFGLAEHNFERPLIFSEKWEYLDGSKQNGYSQSLEHIRMIENDNYTLFTFPIIYSFVGGDGAGPSKLESFETRLMKKSLLRVGSDWLALSKDSDEIPDKLFEDSSLLKEGAKTTAIVNSYERSAYARKLCIEHYGYNCFVCKFDFEKTYGKLGAGYIHVHHRVPIAEIGEEYIVDPIKDLIPLCPNCHSMIHRGGMNLKIEELELLMKSHSS